MARDKEIDEQIGRQRERYIDYKRYSHLEIGNEEYKKVRKVNKMRAKGKKKIKISGAWLTSFHKLK